jgi:hypothetical protein
MAGKKLWIQAAVARMKRRGTLGKFGKATPAKIARAKARGGVEAKRAIFAENMRKIAARKSGRRLSSRRPSR